MNISPILFHHLDKIKTEARNTLSGDSDKRWLSSGGKTKLNWGGSRGKGKRGMKTVILHHSFKEFCYRRGTEQWLLAIGYVGSDVGFILYGEYCSMFETEGMLQKWGVDNTEEGKYTIDGSTCWTPAYGNELLRGP